MVSNPDDWPRFQPELNEFKKLWNSLSDFSLIYCPWKRIGKHTDLLGMFVQGKQYSLLLVLMFFIG